MDSGCVRYSCKIITYHEIDRGVHETGDKKSRVKIYIIKLNNSN